MTMPGFTAELSLHKTSERYYATGIPGALAGSGKVVPQAHIIKRCACIPGPASTSCKCWLMMVFDDGTAISLT
jgi:hypothetical protein